MKRASLLHDLLSFNEQTVREVTAVIYGFTLADNTSRRRLCSAVGCTGSCCRLTLLMSVHLTMCGGRTCFRLYLAYTPKEKFGLSSIDIVALLNLTLFVFCSFLMCVRVCVRVFLMYGNQEDGDTGPIEEFLSEAVKGNCEGLMVKTLTVRAADGSRSSSSRTVCDPVFLR